MSNPSRCGDLRKTSSSYLVSPSAGNLSPASSLTKDLIAASILCIVEVVNCISVAVILRGQYPDDYIDPLFRHVTYGFIVHQLITSAISNMPGIIAPSAFENLVVFLAVQDSICLGMKGKPYDAQFVTFLAAVSLSAVMSSILLSFAALPRLTKLLSYLPDYVRHGVFASIGISIFLLGFGTFELEVLEVSSWTSPTNLLKWFPAYVLGMGLWYLDENFPSRALLIGFIIFVITACQAVRLFAGTSISEAVKGGWLLGELGPRGFGEYFGATYGSLNDVDWALVVQSIPQLFVACILGPVLNATINCVVLEGALQIKVDVTRELRSQALGSLVTGLCFGFNSYFAVADTSLMRKAGGCTARPVVFMTCMLGLVCVVPPVLPALMALIPLTLPAAVFVFIGFAIAWGCVADMRTTLKPMEYAFGLLTCAVCLFAGVPQGLFISCCVCLFQQLTSVEKDGEANAGDSSVMLAQTSHSQRNP